ncbi:MAG: delta-60 repeat domain-containing protein [Dokdonella sp.]
MRIRAMRTWALGLALINVCARATDGDLDTRFGVDGFARNGLQGGNGDNAPIVVQADGRIVTCGTASGGPYPDIQVARFTPDGKPDLQFAGSGKMQLDFAANADYCNAIALQPDGKIVVAGWTFSTSGSGWDFAVARVNADGSLDDRRRHRQGHAQLQPARRLRSGQQRGDPGRRAHSSGRLRQCRRPFR